jgi:DNA polymerase-3 subunit beta
MPILECVLFEREGDALRLLASDLDISISQRLLVPFESNGSGGRDRVAVPARRLLDTLRALPDVPVTFASDGEFGVELTTDQGRYKMVGFDGADFPALPSLDDARALETDGGVVRRAFSQTAFAVSRDALRPAMMGVFFQMAPDGGRVVATDGHRLVRLQLESLGTDPAIEFVVPEKALSLAAKAAPEEGPCTLRIGSGHAEFDFGDVRVLGRLIDEPYPNYQAVIPLENERHLTVSREAMLRAVRRVALYSSSMTHQVRLSLAEGQVVISAEDIERNSEARETVMCEYDSEPMEIGFNAVYLSEVLDNARAEDVLFEFSSPNRAGVVRPASQTDGEDVLMLIMPVMLNSYA